MISLRNLALLSVLLIGGVAEGQEIQSNKKFVIGEGKLEQRVKEHVNQVVDNRTSLDIKTGTVRAIIDEIVIKKSVDDYINQVSSGSRYFNSLERNFSNVGGLKHVKDWYYCMNRLCLDLATKYRNGETLENRETLKQDIERQNPRNPGLAEYICNVQMYLSLYAGISEKDFSTPDVFQYSKAWGELRTREFKKLLIASKNFPLPDSRYPNQKEEFVVWLYKAGFGTDENGKYNEQLGRIEYVRYLNEQNNVSNNLRNSLKAAIKTGPIKSAIARKEIDNMADTMIRVRNETYYRYFGK